MPKQKVERVKRVCLRHPHRPAAARCDQCAKPMCTQCIVEEGEERFCSPACANARARYREREAATQGRRAVERTSIGEWAVRGGIVLLVGTILYYVFLVRNVRGVGDLLDMLLRTF